MSQTTNSKIAFFYRGSWYHRTKEILSNGTTKYSKIGGFKTSEEAEESYYKHLKKYEIDKIKLFPEVDKEVLFKDYIVYWYEQLYSKKISNQTSMTFSYVIYKLIIPNLPYDIKLRLVTSEYLLEIMENIDKLGKTTANKSREVLNLIFKTAIQNHIIASNPVANLKNYPRGKVNIKILTKEEIKKLLAATCQNKNWYLEILLALFCGLRKGEIRGLKFEDFNHDEQTVTISRQLANEYKLSPDQFKVEKVLYVEKAPKTENSYRKLKVPSIIWEELEIREKIINQNKKIYKDKYNDNNYISCQCNGLPHAATSLNAYLHNICVKNGLPKITVHGLRHMYATILIEQGVQLHIISGLLGHSSIHTTFDIYLDIIEEKEKITAFMNNTYSMEEK